MATGHTYVLLDFQEQGVSSNPLINRYYYQQTSGAGDGAIHLVDAFIQNVLPAILAVQSTALIHTKIEVWTPDVASDFTSRTLTPSEDGTVVGEVMPGFVAFGFIFNRPLRNFRSGGKRIPGVPEASVVNGVATSGALTNLEALATAFAEVISPSGVSADFAPVLVKNLMDVIPIREVAQVTNVAYKRITTQSTRKQY